MKNMPEPTAFIESPELLPKFCMDVIERIDEKKASSDLDEIELQLREVAHAIDKLEKAGTSVPDGLRQLKTDLVAKLAVRDEIISRLGELADGLDKVLRDLRQRIGRTKSLGYRIPSNEPTTSREILRKEIILALEVLGGAGSPKEVRDEIERHLEGRLLPLDEKKLSQGVMVWHRKCGEERSRMVADGILKSDSPTGIWELSRKNK